MPRHVRSIFNSPSLFLFPLSLLFLLHDMMDEEDLESSHHFLTSPDFDVKMEGGDSLSQGDYDSSDQEALLDDVIIAQKDSDSSSSSED